MLTVGDKFPQFNLKATVSNDLNNAFVDITNETYKGKWLVVFFYPKDFTFVCPTEITGFAKLDQAFKDRDAQLLTGSTDSEFVHHAWRTHHKDLNSLPFPMLADIKRELTSDLGILGKDGVAQRATFIVDPDGIIRFVYVTDLSVGRSPEEVLRVTVQEGLVVLGEAHDLGRADEGEVLRVEEHHQPLALVRLVRDVDERVVQVVGDGSLEVELGKLVADSQHSDELLLLMDMDLMDRERVPPRRCPPGEDSHSGPAAPMHQVDCFDPPHRYRLSA